MEIEQFRNVSVDCPLVDEALNRTGNIGKFSDEYVYYVNVLIIIAAGQRLDDNNRRLFTLILNLILS